MVKIKTIPDEEIVVVIPTTALEVVVVSIGVVADLIIVPMVIMDGEEVVATTFVPTYKHRYVCKRMNSQHSQYAHSMKVCNKLHDYD